MHEATIHGVLGEAARRFGERAAIRAQDQEWSFAALHTGSLKFAGHLAAAGVTPGDRVAVMMGNRVEFVLAVHALSSLGAAAVLVSPMWKAVELDHALRVTGARQAIGDGSTAPLLAERLGAGAVVDVDTMVPGPDDQAPRGHDVDPDTDALLVFSSGTTGMPKAVRHTHRTMLAATAHWVEGLGLGPNDRFQVATPPSHILGLLNLVAAIAAGAMVRLHARFDLDESLRCIQAERMTLEMAVAPIALAMANHPDLESYDLSSLRYIMWGATPVTESVAATVTARSGVRFLPAYGASELPLIAINPVDQPDRWRLDSAGLPARDVEIRVVDLASGAELTNGEVGEIQARGPSVMVGYLPEEATAEAFDDGWYRTGDVGWVEPEGWVHLTDRAKELIKVKGFQVAPAEIEAVLHGHESVLDCAVFGVPDDTAGEVPVAVVRLDPDRPIDPQDLADLVATTLAPYKRLSDVVVVDEIPRLPSGKVLRRHLRDAWVDGS